MKEKPGVMLYFDRLPYLNRMDDTQRGRLFLWIMEYAQYGVIPEIEDPMLGMAWDVVKPAIDLDTERYEAKCERNRENIQKRWNKDSNTTVSSRIPNTKTNSHSETKPECGGAAPSGAGADQGMGGRAGAFGDEPLRAPLCKGRLFGA